MKLRPITYKEFLRLKTGDLIWLVDDLDIPMTFVTRILPNKGTPEVKDGERVTFKSRDTALCFLHGEQNVRPFRWGKLSVPVFNRDDITELTDYDS